MGTSVIHWEINARNARDLQRFYSRLFGWKVDTNNALGYGMMVPSANEGIAGGIGQADPAIPAPSVTFYVGVDDPQKYLDRMKALGGRIVVPVTNIPNAVTFALFADPEGNVIGLLRSASAVMKQASRPKRRGRRTLAPRVIAAKPPRKRKR